MTALTTQVTASGDTAAEDAGPSSTGGDQPLVEEELLVEDVSIDGMCGVY
jgi:mycofactocin precursor